jgi:DNA polymerase-1
MDLRSFGFRQVWAADFEFAAPLGERPRPICLVARELRTGRTVRLWEDDLRRRTEPPYPTGPDTLFVAYYASAEIGCHLALGWPVPTHVLDLYVEFRNRTNGRELPCGAGLLGALTYHGIDGIDTAEKEVMRQLALRGGPWTGEERGALLEYCESDVIALDRLLASMLPALDVPRAVLRGRYMIAAARIEHHGIPIDTRALTTLREHWVEVQDRLIARIDANYGVFDGRTFKASRFADFLVAHGLPWPRLESGALQLDDDTFRQMARAHPLIAPLRELRVSLSQMRLTDLAVGQDGRNRCLLSAFRARTGRNQPSNSAFVFGPAVWVRGLIHPAPGFGIAYLDWSQQEFAIAAALSGDAKMHEAYVSGDPYLAFGKQAGAIPPDGTKATHGPIREQFKQCALAVLYGMAEISLAQRIGQPVAQARELLRLHRETYRGFWRWSDAAVDHAMLCGTLHTVFGWTLHVGRTPNARSLRNFPMQANGAEMLRLACCYATERGVRVCAPVHDAILIEAPADELDVAVETAERAMADASETVLGGFRLRSDAKLIRYPDRYADERGAAMWRTVWELIGSQPGDLCAGAPGTGAPAQQNPCTTAHPSPLFSVSSLGL